ncbi:MAG: hypothetical protein AB1473_18150 [Thermodesulfobacteriota bacterium]
MTLKVFYAWQSDTDSRLNRSFIQRAAEKALKQIARDFELEESPRLDQATQDVPGMADIAATILQKIDEASVFLADLTIVGATDRSGRLTPNPNVLFELGYAVKRLGWQRVIAVMNIAYGNLEQQIFDIRGRKLWAYALDASADQDRRNQQRSLLAGMIASAMKLILDETQLGTPAPDVTNEEATKHLKQLIRTGDEIGLDELMSKVSRELKEKLSDDRYVDWTESISAQEVESRLDDYTADSYHLALLMAHGGRWGGPHQWRCWRDCIEKISDLPELPSGWSNEFEISRCLRLYPALMCFYAAGFGALVGDKFDTLRFLLHEPRIPFDRSVREPALALTPWEVLARHKRHYIEPNGRYIGLQKAALSTFLFEKLEPILTPLLNRPQYYSSFFDQFEVLLGLSSLQVIHEGVPGRDRRDALVGRFATLYEARQFVSSMEAEVEVQKDEWPPLKSKVLDCSYQECKKLFSLYREEVELFQDNQRYRHRRITPQ